MFWINNYVKTQGLVNPVSMEPPSTGGYLPGMNLGINETVGKNYMLIIVVFVAWVLYTIRKMFAPKKQLSSVKEPLIDDYFEEAL